ncbi:NAD-dependent epimerase/dehydratase [Pectobacterium parmentieri WPP163]|uniref:NAD-dependent epimerase/dehydratase family protein n=1 Tax=Pectobacterium parmentieri TaxID=1905730 RepID=UPI0001B0F0CF|nr:SDR family oxidoreductase [Pectobacterium parmentieri]ACX88313.1 NAD-dependent epimerase/dehydratase [Pectobacterium parmentieri WPP163]
MKNTILVAGAGGYIGIPLCHLLINHGYRVVAFDRFFFGLPVSEMPQSPRFHTLRGDIRYITPDILHNVEAVIDLAGLSNDPAAQISSALTHAINYEGACHLANTAKKAGIQRYIYMSSASVYGRSGSTSADEETECHPQSLYAELKLNVERELLRLRDTTFHPVILRNATVFGLAPRMRYDLSVNIMTRMAVRDKFIAIAGDGLQQRPFIHVQDVARAVLLALRLNRQLSVPPVFNIGGDALNHNINSIAAVVAEEVPNVKIVHRTQSLDTRDYRLCFSHAKNTLGFSPTRSIRDGVREIAHILMTDQQAGTQPTCFTAQWYTDLIEWEKRLQLLQLDGHLF